MTTQENVGRVSFSSEQQTEVQSELGRILKSASFQSSKRCHDFLQFIVSHALDGDIDSLTERFLGADLFGRPIDYDTKADAIVRVRANDVRRRLAEYYSGHKSAPYVVISLSVGSYVPEFQWAPLVGGAGDPSASALSSPGGPTRPDSAEESLTAEIPHGSVGPVLQRRESWSQNTNQPANGSIATSVKEVEHSQRRGISRRLAAIGSIAAGLAILALAVGCFTLWQQLQTAHRTLYPWQDSPAVAGFWGGFLGNQKDTDLVLSDSSYSLLQAVGNKRFELSDYLSRSYMSELKDPDPKLAAALARISNWGLGSPSEFEVAQRILALDPARQKLHFYSARKYMPDLIRRDNAILIGSRFGNPWAELFESHMNFVFNPENPDEIINRAPDAGEFHTYDYTPSGSIGYCIVAYLPTPDHNGSTLLIQGTSGEPTEAAGDFLLSETKMAEFEKKVGVSKLPYFEFLLKTSWVRGTPINSSVVAFRTYANPG